ncbi:MAG TPA: hypothetical protein VFB16_13655 [Bauldia sp.]|nr:hypothetical protein [Bauldia sp.]
MIELLKDPIEIVTHAVGALAIVFGVYQYYRSEKWKRLEFVSKSYKETIDDALCQRALTLIDYPADIISSVPDLKEFSKKDDCGLHKVALASALDFSQDEVTALDVEVRKYFDRLFVYMEQFERAIRAGLVKEAEVLPYFNYWIYKINTEDSAGAAIRKYVEEAEFDDVERFLKRGSASPEIETSSSR